MAATVYGRQWAPHPVVPGDASPYKDSNLIEQARGQTH